MDMPTLESAGAPPSLSDAIAKLMENPEIISTVASALGNMTAPKASPPNEPREEAEDSPPAAEQSTAASAPELSALVSKLAPIMSGLSGSGGGSAHSVRKSELSADLKRREELLCALKPYVSDGRREAIDYIIRISRVSELLKNYNTK